MCGGFERVLDQLVATGRAQTITRETIVISDEEEEEEDEERTTKHWKYYRFFDRELCSDQSPTQYSQSQRRLHDLIVN